MFNPLKLFIWVNKIVKNKETVVRILRYFGNQEWLREVSDTIKPNNIRKR